jgi:hypothetical protein
LTPGLVHPSTDWWACARCAVKLPGCSLVCNADPTGLGCAACLGSGYEDCKSCYDW